MNNKLVAYTLLETIIAIILMSIMSALVYTIVGSFYSQYNAFNQSNKKISSFSLLKSNLKKEFFICDQVESKPNGFLIKLKDSLKISYVIENKFLIRTQNNVMDTHLIEVKELRKEFADQDKMVVEQVKLEVNLLNKDYLLTFNKDYGTAIQINNFFYED